MTRRKLMWATIAVGVAMGTTIFAWEQVRQPLLNWLDGEVITYERPRQEPTAYELWLKRPDVQNQLQVMYERHQLEEQDALLKAQQVELEQAKEELRAKELQLGSLQ